MPIVGIGASAGGLDALSRLLSHLPNDTGLAYVVVQHLDPVHESALAEIPGRGAGIPVAVATDGVRLEANHVNVIPPNAGMTVSDGHLKVVERRGSVACMPERSVATGCIHFVLPPEGIAERLRNPRRDDP